MQNPGIDHNYSPTEKTGRNNFDNGVPEILAIGDIRMLPASLKPSETG
jgi:hypothetical protein